MKDAETEAVAMDESTAFAKALKRVKKTAAQIERKEKRQRRVRAAPGSRVIMLKHIPHGFFEKEMKGYFSQFGKVLRLRLARSKKTGKSRGYAFVEFQFEEVAKIAAEAMNNYLMFERLIKCEVVSDDVDANTLFRHSHIQEFRYPSLKSRRNKKLEQERELSKEEESEILTQRLAKVKEQNKRLAEMGISYQFSVSSKVKPNTTTTPQKQSSTKEASVVQSPKKLDESASKSSKRTSEKQRKSSDNTEAKQLAYKQKFSPKLLRSKQKLAEQNTPTSNKESKVETKSKSPDLPRISPKNLRSRKAEAAGKTKATDLPKVSPKMLRSRKNEGVGPVNVSTSNNSKFSPKLLRSRKSEASGLTPMKDVASPKPKKGRKSVF